WPVDRRDLHSFPTRRSSELVRPSDGPTVRCSRRRHRSRLRDALPERAASMTLVLDPRHAAAIGRHGEADYPAEACGLIGGAIEGDRKIAVQLVPLANGRTDSARNRYLIDP